MKTLQEDLNELLGELQGQHDHYHWMHVKKLRENFTARVADLESKLDAETKRADNAEMASGAAYQAVGSLASDFDVFEHPLIQKLLTVLSRQEEHEDLLPWPTKSLDEWRREAREAPESEEHVQYVGDVERLGQNSDG